MSPFARNRTWKSGLRFHRSTLSCPHPYRIAPAFDGSPLRVVLSDPVLIRKRSEWRDAYFPLHRPVPQAVIRRRSHVLDRMRRGLDRLELARAVSEIMQELAHTDIDPGHALFTCSAIHHGDHTGLKVDAFGYRVHSIVTRTARAIRPHLRIDGESLVELDVANAQPLILAAALKDPAAWTAFSADVQHNGEMGGRGGDSPVFSRVCAEEVESFARLCEEGTLYEFLMEQGGFADRETVKRLLCRDVLFGRPEVCGTMTELFARTWPACLEAVRQIKRRCGYKAVAQMLQRLESDIVIEGACGRLVAALPNMLFLTVHDSLLVPAAGAAVAERALQEALWQRGVGARIRVKGVSVSGDEKIFPESA